MKKERYSLISLIKYVKYLIYACRANAIQTEVITSHKKNVEIDWTWQELEEKEDCEELNKVTDNLL